MKNYIEKFFDKKFAAPSGFENFLISKGYIPFSFNFKKNMIFVGGTGYYSTMGNLSNHYFHKDDKIIEKIVNGLSVLKDEITWDDRKGEIVFGLHECEKPATIICPRPNISVIRKDENGNIREYDEFYDDSMNVILEKFSYEEIFNAMYDKSITLEIDLTK